MRGSRFCLRRPAAVPRRMSGGAPGYAEYLKAIADLTHPDHEAMLRWGPEAFDPNVIDQKALELAVGALSEQWQPHRRKLRSK